MLLIYLVLLGIFMLEQLTCWNMYYNDPNIFLYLYISNGLMDFVKDQFALPRESARVLCVIQNVRAQF